MEDMDTLPPARTNRILSSTLRSSVAGGRPRRRLRRVDLDDEEDEVQDRLNSTVNAAASVVPFPGLESIAYSPIRREDDDSDHPDDLAERSTEGEENDAGGGDEDGEGGQDLDVKTLRQLKGISEGARKKMIRRPLPKLDPPTLLGERGLPALLKVLEKVRFRGRGHEFEDLERLMFTYEAWANRMLPKFAFVDVMERLEAVSTKREVHSALQGLRAGTWPPTISAEFVRDEDDDSDSSVNTAKANNNNNNQQAAAVLDPFDDDELRELLRLPDSPSSPEPVPSTSTAVQLQQQEVQSAEGEELTAAERAERNRLAALARLEARRRAGAAAASSPHPVSRGPSSLKRALLKLPK